MRHLLYAAVAGMLLTPPALWAKDKAVEELSGSCGTSIDFFDTPKDAAKQALKDEKLVLVLHVSGNFEDPRFT
jgi:hypothetical protein